MLKKSFQSLWLWNFSIPDDDINLFFFLTLEVFDFCNQPMGFPSDI